jgi:hypothetical protein
MNRMLDGYWLPAIRAAIELDRKDPARAGELLRAADPYELGQPSPLGGTLYPVYLRGQAESRLRRGSEAAAEFQKLLDHRSIVTDSLQCTQVSNTQVSSVRGSTFRYPLPLTVSQLDSRVFIRSAGGDAGLLCLYFWVSTDRQSSICSRKMKAKIVALKQEVESIRFADALYWKRRKDCSREASAEYQGRQDRLREIKSELALLDAAESLRTR